MSHLLHFAPDSFEESRESRNLGRFFTQPVSTQIAQTTENMGYPKKRLGLSTKKDGGYSKLIVACSALLSGFTFGFSAFQNVLTASVSTFSNYSQAREIILKINIAFSRLSALSFSSFISAISQFFFKSVFFSGRVPMACPKKQPPCISDSTKASSTLARCSSPLSTPSSLLASGSLFPLSFRLSATC